MIGDGNTVFGSTVNTRATVQINTNSLVADNTEQFMMSNNSGQFCYLVGLFLINTTLATTVGTFNVRNGLGAASVLQFRQPNPTAPIGTQMVLSFEQPFKTALQNAAFTIQQGNTTQGLWHVIPDFFYSST